MTRFFVDRAGVITPIGVPDQVQPFLGAAHHWKAGRSAQELAHAWMGAVAPPAAVTAVLSGVPEWAVAGLVQAFFEHQTAIDELPGPSQTDLLAVTALADGLGVIGVEGKVDEDFGPLAADYVAKAGPGSRVPLRFQGLAERLGLDRALAEGLRYQLLHRTVATLVEARRYRAQQAVMLVHSFATAAQDDHFADFAAFAQALGVGEVRRNGISQPRRIEGQSLRLAWVSDKPRKSD